MFNMLVAVDGQTPFAPLGNHEKTLFVGIYRESSETRVAVGDESWVLLTNPLGASTHPVALGQTRKLGTLRKRPKRPGVRT